MSLEVAVWCLAAYGFIRLIEECITSVAKMVRRMSMDKYEFKAHMKEIEIKANKPEKPEIKGFKPQD